MTSLVPLIETTRGDTTECLHFGAVAVTRGRVLASVGAPSWLSFFTRSTLKALQALPFMESGTLGEFCGASYARLKVIAWISRAAHSAVRQPSSTPARGIAMAAVKQKPANACRLRTMRLSNRMAPPPPHAT